ncbi:MAG: CBS domain-containing protein [Candidatus Omnitrophica bacterium]|nr:CBS domain-containing protein [Candidatus Omnitrophota bacterium]
MLKAKDIMTSQALSVTPDTPISIAVKLLAIRKISGLPVVDCENNLVGVVSEKDLLGILLNEETAEDKTVSEFMTREVSSFSTEDSVDSICQFLLGHNFRRVPIVEGGKLKGLISRADIITHIWRTRFGKEA